MYRGTAAEAVGMMVDRAPVCCNNGLADDFVKVAVIVVKEGYYLGRLGIGDNGAIFEGNNSCYYLSV